MRSVPARVLQQWLLAVGCRDLLRKVLQQHAS
jgi:hypothetical protein